MKPEVNIMWFRRDLRLEDNAALYHALKSGLPVVPVFIFDRNILDDLEKRDPRVEFIYDAVQKLGHAIKQHGGGLEVFYDKPEPVYRELLGKYDMKKVFINYDYEQYAVDRDSDISTLLKKHGGELHAYKDQVIFDRSEVVKDDGKPYTVFTPYKRRWLQTFKPFHIKPYPSTKYLRHLYKHNAKAAPALATMGFEKTGFEFPSEHPSDELIRHYARQRDFPGLDATSRVGLHLRFGTISIRDLVHRARSLSDTYLNELIWREFYAMILWHFPQVRKGDAFKPAYDRIKWRYDEKDFQKWCEGKTGYPLVDAGMRQLNTIGFMHNRVRMVTASFLTKHLLIDWRWGEEYFARLLLDYEYASNNGGWQWAAGCGCDAAPYFRVFNPTLQQKRFDPKDEYIKRWVPEYGTPDYPEPMVVHEEARARAIEVYKKALKEG